MKEEDQLRDAEFLAPPTAREVPHLAHAQRSPLE